MLMWAAADRPAPGAPAPALLESDATEGRTSPHFAFGRGLHFCVGRTSIFIRRHATLLMSFRVEVSDISDVLSRSDRS